MENIEGISEMLKYCIKGFVPMRSEINRLKDQLLEMQKTLLSEAEVLKHMTCEQCLLKSRAERLEKAAVTLKNGAELLDSWLKKD